MLIWSPNLQSFFTPGTSTKVGRTPVREEDAPRHHKGATHLGTAWNHITSRQYGTEAFEGNRNASLTADAKNSSLASTLREFVFWVKLKGIRSWWQFSFWFVRNTIVVTVFLLIRKECDRGDSFPFDLKRIRSWGQFSFWFERNTIVRTVFLLIWKE